MSSRETSVDKFIIAAEYGRLKEVMEMTRKFSNDVKVLGEAMIVLCMKGCLDIVKWLVSYSAVDVNYNSSEEWLYTPLTAASRNNELDVIKYLVETCHADINLTDSTGSTSLTWACSKVSMSLSMYLLCEVTEIDVNIVDNVGNTALHYAVWCCKSDNAQLHEACYTGDVTEVLRLVYVRGHDINIQNNDGYTPLHYACLHGHSDIVEILMLAGADETIITDEGKTPSKWAEIMGQSELQKLMNRDSLWQVIQWRRKKMKLSQNLLTLRLIKKRRFRRIIISNKRRKLNKQSEINHRHNHFDHC